MPVRATKRGAERSPLAGSADVLVCGASFAGLAVARELAGSGADVLVLDRYEIGERQTSACAAPTAWIEALGLGGADPPDVRRARHPPAVHDAPLGAAVDVLDVRLPRALRAACGSSASGARFETAVVAGRDAGAGEALVVHTDRGDLASPLVVDGLGWRRVLARGAAARSSRRRRRSRAASRSTRRRPARTSSCGSTRATCAAGYCWSFPADDEVRVGVGSFDPRDHVREPDRAPGARPGARADGFQGNWIPHRMRAPVEDGVFFVGDSAGHCLPATAEGIRPALYFGAACGRELRLVLDGRQSRGQALERYAAACEDKRYA